MATNSWPLIPIDIQHLDARTIALKFRHDLLHQTHIREEGTLGLDWRGKAFNRVGGTNRFLERCSKQTHCTMPWLPNAEYVDTDYWMLNNWLLTPGFWLLKTN